MTSKTRLVYLLITTFCLAGCGYKSRNPVSENGLPSADTIQTALAPRYAKGFKITVRPDGVKLLSISEPNNNHAIPELFALVPKGTKAEIPDGYTVIPTPTDRVICMTTPQLAGFTGLNAYDKVVATSTTRRMQNKEWLARLKDGRVKKIGMEGNFDTEIIIASQPDIIFVSPNRRGGYEVMKELNIPLVPYWAFKETSPLGLSEWIKVAGMFIGKEEEACQLFAQMEQRYNLLKAKVSNVKQRPSVFSGEMRRDTWYVPGGQSFYARLFADAGADYFMKDNTETGGVLMDFETVYAKGYNAGYWRVMNGYKGEFSYEALKASNPQYADFRAFKEKKVIYCNLEWIPLYENLPLSPDVLLSDMIKAFHPELLPDYHLCFIRFWKRISIPVLMLMVTNSFNPAYLFHYYKMAEVSDFSHSVKGYSNIPAISSAICLSVNRLAFISSSRL